MDGCPSLVGPVTRSSRVMFQTFSYWMTHPLDDIQWGPHWGISETGHSRRARGSRWFTGWMILNCWKFDHITAFVARSMLSTMLTFRVYLWQGLSFAIPNIMSAFTAVHLREISHLGWIDGAIWGVFLSIPTVNSHLGDHFLRRRTALLLLMYFICIVNATRAFDVFCLYCENDVWFWCISLVFSTRRVLLMYFVCIFNMTRVVDVLRLYFEQKTSSWCLLLVLRRRCVGLMYFACIFNTTRVVDVLRLYFEQKTRSWCSSCVFWTKYVRLMGFGCIVKMMWGFDVTRRIWPNVGF